MLAAPLDRVFTSLPSVSNSSEETLSQDFGDVCRSRFDRGTMAALVFESEGRLGDERLIASFFVASI